MSKSKKLTALLLALCLTVSLMPTAAFAVASTDTKENVVAEPNGVKEL